MPNTEGTIESVTKKEKSSGDKYRLVTIDGVTFFCWDKSLFSSLKEGHEVAVDFNKNKNDGDVFRNIQNVEILSGTEEDQQQGGTQASTSGISEVEKRIESLRLAIYYAEVTDKNKDKISKQAQAFLDFINQ